MKKVAWSSQVIKVSAGIVEDMANGKIPLCIDDMEAEVYNMEEEIKCLRDMVDAMMDESDGEQEE